MIVIPKINSNTKTFPQANDIYKVLKFVDNATYRVLEKYLENVNMSLVPRQLDYYRSAASYIGLFDNNQPSSLALRIFKFDKDVVLINIVSLILEDSVFNHYFENRNIESLVVLLLKQYKINTITAKRRASTVINWVKWCDQVLKENTITVEIRNGI